MPDGSIRGLIQNIVALRSLQLQEDAQHLQQQQLGINAAQLQLQQGRQPGEVIQGLQSALQHTTNPQMFGQYAPQLAQNSGVPEQMIRDIITQTPAATETTRASAVQRGVTGAQGTLDQPAAYQALTGGGTGDLARNNLLANLFGQAGDYYTGLGPDERKGFEQGVLQRTATGETVGDAAMSTAAADFMKRAAPAVRDQVVEIGKGMVPSASEDAQMRLGYARFRGEQRIAESNLALEQLKTQAELENVHGQLDAKKFQEINDLIRYRGDLMKTMLSSGSSMTPEGLRSYTQQFNAYNEQIRNALPMIYGQFSPDGKTVMKAPHFLEDLPMDKGISISSVFDYLNNRIKQP